jgi:hypothetical protein
MSDEFPSYDHGHTFFGVDLPDELIGMLETGSFIRAVRWATTALSIIIIAAGVVWFANYEMASKATEVRLGPVEKARAEVAFLEEHHGTDEEICRARIKLVQAENVAMIGDGNDLDHLNARMCTLNLELAHSNTL